MLKLEIRLNENKIRTEGKYTTKESDGTLVFVGRGRAKDYGCFGMLITALKREMWFMNYVEKWIWYNSDDGESEDDFAVEDVLLFYTNRASAA